jgi:hypothetical protein
VVGPPLAVVLNEPLVSVGAVEVEVLGAAGDTSLDAAVDVPVAPTFVLTPLWWTVLM